MKILTKLFISLVVIAGLLTSAILPFTQVSAAIAIEDSVIVDGVTYYPDDEIVERRTETSKTYYLGNSRYALDSYIGAVHYKDNYADPKEQWKDIDLTWEGNRITKAPYELTLEGNKATVKDKKTGEVSTIELLEIGGIPTPSQAWEMSKGLAKAFATDLEVVAGNGSVSFARILKSDKAAVEAKYKVTGKMPFRVRARDEEDELPVEWTIKDGILTETLKPDRPIKYPVRIDPTIDKTVGADADDAYAYDIYFEDSTQIRMGRETAYDIRAFARFTGVEIPADAIIGANCYASFFVWSSTQPGIYFKVKADDSANPDAPTDATEVFAITPTTAGVDWDDQADVDDWANTPDIQSVIAELYASYDYSAGAAITIIVDDDGSGTDERLYMRSWQYNDHSLAPKLHIEYTIEADPPTVTTQAATDIEDTTATGNGNITAVNNETCDLRGFVWDLATQGVPGNVAPGASGYANDVPESDGFGTGAFTGSLTGLPTGDTIYCRAYAHNENGYGYGDEINFLTKPAAPTNVAATENQSDKVVITWTKSTGATGYKVYEGANLLDTLGDVATYDHTTGDAPTITAGSVVATDGTETAHIALSLSETSVANGTTYTYKVVALNATGDSVDSSTDTGYRLASALTYQWNRSSGDADEDYSEIEGATSSTYEDTATPAGSIDNAGAVTASDGTSSVYVELSLAGESTADGAGRYFTCTLVSTDADNTPQTATANRGYRGVGAITYQWQRSSGDADADYSNIDGATTDPYNDTDGVVTPDGRYYQCIVSAVDASNTPQTSDNDRGYKAVAPIPGAPTDFTLSLSDSTISVSWTLGADAVTTIIRRQAERYPVDITDGVEAYNGAETSFNDTGLNVEDNEYFYRAWSHNVTGYSVDYAEGVIGGVGMILIAILGLGAVMSFLAVRSSFFPLKMMAGFSWFGAFVYWINADVVTDGSPEDTVIMLGLLFAGILFLLWGLGTRRSTSEVEEHYSPTGKILDRIVKSTRTSEPKRGSSMMTESNLEYRDRVRKAARGGKTSRRK